MSLSNPFTPEERSAWAPPERIGAAEWTERYMVLGPRVTATPGPVSLDRTPYVRGVLDALSDREHRKVVLVSSAQWGKSQLGRYWLGYVADVDPGPALIVFPNEQACKETMSERVVPMFEDSPRLRALMTGRSFDVKTKSIDLRTCSIYTAWSGSPQALASRPIRYVKCDEIENYKAYTGKQGDSVSQALARMLSFAHRAKAYLASTPKLPTGPIMRSYDACEDRRTYWVTCRDCGRLFEPTWKLVQFEGKDAESEDELRAALAGLSEDPAVIVCSECGSCLVQADLWWGVRRGQWVTKGCAPGEHPPGESVGFRGSGIISPWVGIDRLSTSYLRARLTGLGELQDWHHSMLGAPFWNTAVHGDSTLAVTPDVVRRLAETGGAEGVVPSWARIVTAGVDTASNGWWWVVTAFGGDYRSQLVAYGFAKTESALLDVLGRQWPIDGRPGEFLRVRRAGVDVGGSNNRDSTRTEGTYRLASRQPAIIWPLKGHGGSGEASRPVSTRVHTYSPPGRSHKAWDVKLSTIDTGYFKDMFAGQIRSGAWHPHSDVDRDFVRQVAAEKKVLVEHKVDARTGESREIWRWVPIAVGAANHYWDCCCYALAAAYMLGSTLRAVTPPDAVSGGAVSDYAESKDGATWKIGRR